MGYSYDPKSWETGEVIEKTPLNNIEEGIYYATPNVIHGVITAGETTVTISYASSSAPAFLIEAYCVYQGERIVTGQAVTERTVTFTLGEVLENDVDIYIFTRHYV